MCYCGPTLLEPGRGTHRSRFRLPQRILSLSLITPIKLLLECKSIPAYVSNLKLFRLSWDLAQRSVGKSHAWRAKSANHTGRNSKRFRLFPAVLYMNITSFGRKLDVRTPSLEQTVGNLSGGNQQKVSVAKWLAAEAKILIWGMDSSKKRIESIQHSVPL